MTVKTPLPPEVCPLCGQTNQCAMEIERTTGQKQPPCWCTQATFSAELLARIPDSARNQACICAACAAAVPPAPATTATSDSAIP